MLWMGLAACIWGGPAVPEGVPVGAAHLWLRDGDLMLDDEQITPLSTVDADPLEEVDQNLVATFAHGSGPLWVELPADTPFHIVRRVVNSARATDREPMVLSASGGDVVHPVVAAPRYGLGGACPDGPRPVEGVAPLITISVQTGRDGAWLLGNARFLPVVARYGDVGPVDGLPPGCLQVPACDSLFDGDAAAACSEGVTDAMATPRVGLGGPTGCMAKIASEPAEVEGWKDEVAALVRSLGLGRQPLVMIMPEARVRLDALLALLTGFERAGAGTPAVGTTLLIEGNDGPPLCRAEVRDAAALDQAGARWLGHVKGTAAARQ